MSINDIPLEIIFKIIQDVNLNDLINFSKTSKEYFNFSIIELRIRKKEYLEFYKWSHILSDDDLFNINDDYSNVILKKRIYNKTEFHRINVSNNICYEYTLKDGRYESFDDRPSFNVYVDFNLVSETWHSKGKFLKQDNNETELIYFDRE